MTNAFTTSNFMTPAKRSNPKAAEDLNTQLVNGDPNAIDQMQSADGRDTVTPTIATPKQDSASWDHCADTSKASWPGRKA